MLKWWVGNCPNTSTTQTLDTHNRREHMNKPKDQHANITFCFIRNNINVLWETYRLAAISFSLTLICHTYGHYKQIFTVHGQMYTHNTGQFPIWTISLLYFFCTSGNSLPSFSHPDSFPPVIFAYPAIPFHHVHTGQFPSSHFSISGNSLPPFSHTGQFPSRNVSDSDTFFVWKLTGRDIARVGK